MKIAKHILTRSLTLSLSLALSLSLTHAQTLRGIVLDADNGDAVKGATVALRFSRGETAPISLATSPLGDFVFEKIRPGYYSVEITAQGFESQTIAEVYVAAGKEQVLDIALHRSSSQLAEVTISATQPGRRAPLPLGEIPLTRDQTLRFPATFFDPARLAMAYPGVAQTDDGTNSISIRGNSPASVRWRLEGVDIVNPNHLPNAGTFSDRPAAASGGILMFSAQLLDNSSLLTGAFPAGYGDALGGIMDMNLRKGNSNQHEFTAQAGLIGLDLAAEGPLGKGERVREGETVREGERPTDAPASRDLADKKASAGKSEGNRFDSYLVNYRYSTVGLLGELGVSFGDEQINFQDLSFNLNFEGNHGGRWSVFGLGGLSENIFRHKTDSTEIQSYKDFFDIDFESKTGVLGVSNWFPFKKNGWMKTTVAASSQTSERVSTSPTYQERVSIDDIEDSKFSASITLSQKLGQQFRLLGGVVGNWQGYSATALTGHDQGGYQSFVHHFYVLSQPWAQMIWNSKRQKSALNLGLHNVLLNYKSGHGSQYVPEPRFSFSQLLGKAHRISISAGMYSQTVPEWMQNYLTGLTKTQNIEANYTWHFAPEWSLRAGVFKQLMSDLPYSPSSKRFALNFMEFHLETLYDYVSIGKGKNQGIEIAVERRIANGWFLQANSTLVKSQYKIGDSPWFSTRWDIGHLANLTFGKEWQREKRLGKERTIGLNARAVWTGGVREADIDLEASMLANSTVIDERIGYFNQYPDYFRLDLRVYWRRNLGNRRNSTFAFDIQNLTGRQNLAYHFYDPFTKQIENKTQLGTIPNFSWRLEF